MKCGARSVFTLHSALTPLRPARFGLAILLLVLGPAASAVAQVPSGGLSADPSAFYVPDLSKILPPANSRESFSSSVQILVAMTLLTVAPSIVLMTTCFIRMVVVLALLRQALGTQQLPPSQVLTGLAIFLTLLVMAPTLERMRSRALQPYLEGRMQQLEAVGVAGDELRSFMFEQIEAADNVDDVYMMYEYASRRAVQPGETLARSAVPLTALIPAFILSELKTSFIIGFRIYLPFLVVDMVIATILVSMGMMMMPPVLISLPFKLLLFVLADGWRLVAGSLMASVSFAA